MLRLRQILALIVKEWRTILKDRRSRFVVIAPPIVQFLVFSYAATFDVRDVRYAVVDEDRSADSRDLLARFAASPGFRFVGALDGARAAEDAIDRGDARLVLHVGPDFSERLAEGRDAPLFVALDGRNSNVASVALGYVQAIAARFSAERGAGRPLVLVERAWYNPTLESRPFIVAALPGQIALIVVLLLTGLSVAREREQGTFDQTLVAPLDAFSILVGKAVPAFAFGLLDGLLLSAGGVWLFDLPMTGSPLALCAVLSVYMLAIAGVGLFVSSLATTMQQALLGAFVFVLPAVILSGFTTPIENMPAWLRAATVANPARYVVSGCRAVFLEGAGLADVVRHLVPMAVVAAVTLSAAGWLFRRRTR